MQALAVTAPTCASEELLEKRVVQLVVEPAEAGPIVHCHVSITSVLHRAADEDLSREVQSPDPARLQSQSLLCETCCCCFFVSIFSW